MDHVDIDGASLFYRREGNGSPALVFVHGAFCSHRDWTAQVEHFRAAHEVLAVDLRGHGESRAAAATGSCRIEGFAADTEAVVRSAGVTSAVLVGHSMGCRIVLQMLLDAPDLVRGIVLVDGSCVGSGDPAVAEQAVRQRWAQQVHEHAVTKAIGDMFLEDADPRVTERALAQALAVVEPVAQQMVPGVFGWDAGKMASTLDRVHVPLLAIQSTYTNSEVVRVPVAPDDVTPWMEMLRQHVAEVEIPKIYGVGHFPMVERCPEVNALIASFLERRVSGC